MLTRLVIKNFAVFENQEIEFTQGMNVLSGESGAGKTVLIKAIQAVLGENVDENLIRKGFDQAYIEAAFNAPIPKIIEDFVDPGEEIVFSRIIKRGKPSRSMISGQSCSAKVLKQAGQELVSLTGQHAARKLISTNYQRQLLDDFAKLNNETSKMRSYYKQLREKEGDLDKLNQANNRDQQQVNFWRQEIDFFEKISPQPNEIESLENEIKILSSSEEIQSAAALACSMLLDDNGITDNMAQVNKLLKIDAGQEFEQLEVDLSLATDNLREIAYRIQHLSESIVSDPQRLIEAEDRLKQLNDLCIRHQNNSIVSIEETIMNYQNQLNQITNNSQLTSQLETEISELKQQYQNQAELISGKRKLAAKKMKAHSEKELRDLGLEAEIKINLIEKPADEHGLEKIEFLLKANQGLDFTSLNKGASGGELSRVNLALLLSKQDSYNCYLFDEVDSGIGGQTAHAVANKLKQLSEQGAQLLVITHLVQIASVADSNYLIDKQEGSTVIDHLDSQQLNKELARLIGAQEKDADQVAELIS
jgi:DNA repair protein RecN (Recombination protein N)